MVNDDILIVSKALAVSYKDAAKILEATQGFSPEMVGLPGVLLLLRQVGYVPSLLHLCRQLWNSREFETLPSRRIAFYKGRQRKIREITNKL